MNLYETIRWLLEHGKPKPKEHPCTQERYEMQLKAEMPSEAELLRQRQTVFEEEIVFHAVLYAPVPVLSLIQETVESLIKQTYGQWNLHIVLDVDAQFNGFVNSDERILVERVRVARRDWEGYMFLMSQGDVLSPNALFLLRNAVKHGHDVLYADEDCKSMLGTRSSPVFKPAFSPITMMSYPLTGRPFVFLAELFHEIQLPMVEGEAEEYQMALKVTQRAKSIGHIQKVLYTRGSRCKKPGAQGIRRDVEECIRETKQAGYAVAGAWRGSVRVAAPLFHQKKASLVIARPKDFTSLSAMLQTIEERSVHHDREFIIVDHANPDKELAHFYQELEKNRAARIVQCDAHCTMPHMLNCGARVAKHGVIVFLDSCLMLTQCSDWLDEMTGQLYRNQVGAVGGKLTYPGGSVAHAGYVLGLLGSYASVCFGVEEETMSLEEQLYIDTIREVSAVTASMMAVKASDFWEAGGFEESFESRGFDVDLCLRLREKGKRIVYTPFAKMTLCREPQLPLDGVSRRDKERIFAMLNPILFTGDRFYSVEFDHSITSPLPAARVTAPVAFWEA